MASGDQPLEAVAKGAAGAATLKIAGSVAVKTRVAKALTKLSPQEKEALFGLAPALRNIVLGLREKGEDND